MSATNWQDFTICVHCGMLIRSAAKQCRFCGGEAGTSIEMPNLINEAARRIAYAKHLSKAGRLRRDHNTSTAFPSSSVRWFLWVGGLSTANMLLAWGIIFLTGFDQAAVVWGIISMLLFFGFAPISLIAICDDYRISQLFESDKPLEIMAAYFEAVRNNRIKMAVSLSLPDPEHRSRMPGATHANSQFFFAEDAVAIVPPSGIDPDFAENSTLTFFGPDNAVVTCKDPFGTMHLKRGRFIKWLHQVDGRWYLVSHEIGSPLDYLPGLYGNDMANLFQDKPPSHDRMLEVSGHSNLRPEVSQNQQGFRQNL